MSVVIAEKNGKRDKGACANVETTAYKCTITVNNY